MYILTNCYLTDDFSVDIEEVDNKICFTKQVSNITYQGQEVDYDCNFFVSECTNEDFLELKNVKQAKILECEIVYEKGTVQNDYTKADLIKSFGSQRSIEKLKNSEVNGHLKNPTKRIINKTQILPKIQSSTKLIESFNLKDIFSEEVLEECERQDIQEIELLDVTKRFYRSDNTLRVLLLDALLRLLNYKFVTKDTFKNSSFFWFTPFFENEIESKKLSKLFRDKCIIIVYILILQIEDGKVKLSSVPTFSKKVETVLEYFKLLGCVYNRNIDELKLVNRPMEYTRKHL